MQDDDEELRLVEGTSPIFSYFNFKKTKNLLLLLYNVNVVLPSLSPLISLQW